MGAISVRDLLVGSAAWSQARGLSLVIGHGPKGWTAGFVDAKRQTVVHAESASLHDALAEVYTAAMTVDSMPAA